MTIKFEPTRAAPQCGTDNSEGCSAETILEQFHEAKYPPISMSAFIATVPLLRLRNTCSNMTQSRPTSSRDTVAVASAHRRRKENVPGNVFVDSSCIDCDTCRWLAPDVFQAENGMSAVYKQPTTREQTLQALRAAVACPTGSIRTEEPSPLVRDARDSFPLPAIDSLSNSVVPNVYYNGFAAEGTFGGSSWLLVHPEGPDPYAVMFDCPRFFGPLAKAIRELTAPVGGVRYLVLSHRDDVAGHDKWAEALGAKRVMHRRECNTYQGTDACEVKLDDTDFPYRLADGAEILHVPGHTRGSIAMLHGPSKSMFTGDHLFYSARTNMLAGSQRYCFYSWKEQIESVAKLLEVPFLHGWPAHGRHFHFRNDDEKRDGIERAVEYMSEQTGRG